MPDKGSKLPQVFDIPNDTLEGAFRQRHPGFRPANDDHKLTGAAA